MPQPDRITPEEAELLLRQLLLLEPDQPKGKIKKKPKKRKLTAEEKGDAIQEEIFDFYYSQPFEVHPASAVVEEDLFDIDLRKGRPERDSAAEEALVTRTFNYYRKAGFPYPKCNDRRLAAVLPNLCRSASSIDGLFIKSNPVGNSEATAFHPEIYNVRCRDRKTPLEIFDDDAQFKRCIRSRIRRGDNVRPHGIRRHILTAPGCQSASNFRPTAAKSIIEYLGAKHVFDPCMGWGGRMLGALSAKASYVGVDPNTSAILGNKSLLHSLRRVNQSLLSPVTLIWGCMEDVIGQGRFAPDLVFTSPPYFDIEHYSNELTQSYLKYPTSEMWNECFLRHLIEGAYRDLVSGGHLALNVNYNMLPEVFEYAARCGFFLVETLTLLMGYRPTKSNNKKNRREPIVIFRKEI